MKISRKLPRTAIVAGMVTMMLAAGTGTALAATAGPGPGYKGPAVTPTAKPAVSYTKVTFYKDGRKVTEEVPTDSLGIVTPSSGLTLGDSCVLDFIKGFGGLAAEANDGASLKELYLSEVKGLFAPYLDCSVWLRHHVTKPKPKVVKTEAPAGGDD